MDLAIETEGLSKTFRRRWNKQEFRAVQDAVDPGDLVGAVDALGQAVRFQVKGVHQDPPMFRALVTPLDGKDEELRVMAANILAPIRDRDFRGDSGRPENKAPMGGWQQWLDTIATKAAGYRKDYEVCASVNRSAEERVDLFCKGETYLHNNPALAFKYTLESAEKGYVPAQ